MRARLIASSATLLGSLCCLAHAHADITASVAATTATSGALTTYTYQVANSLSSTGFVTEFDLGLPTSANLTAIAAPADFFPFYDPGDPSIMFTAFLDGGIAPGMTDIFSFSSPDAPGSIPDQLAGVDDLSGMYITLPGSTAGPSDTPTATPEPSTIALLGTGLMGFAGFVMRRLC